MTLDKNNVIRIPTWLIAVFLPLVISIIAAIIVSNANGAATRKQVEINTDQIKEKVSRNEFDIIKDQLDRIENKVDNYISKNSKK